MNSNVYWLTLCELFVKHFTCIIVILKMFPVGVYVWIHMNIRLAHVLVDDYVSQVMDMEMSNQKCWLMYNMRLDWPNTRDGDFSLHNMCVVSLDLRLLHVLKMWTHLLRGHQMLHRNWVVIKVFSGSVKKHTARHSRSRWDFPSLQERDISGPLEWFRSRSAWPCEG